MQKRGGCVAGNRLQQQYYGGARSKGPRRHLHQAWRRRVSAVSSMYLNLRNPTSLWVLSAYRDGLRWWRRPAEDSPVLITNGKCIYVRIRPIDIGRTWRTPLVKLLLAFLSYAITNKISQRTATSLSTFYKLLIRFQYLYVISPFQIGNLFLYYNLVSNWAERHTYINGRSAWAVKSTFQKSLWSTLILRYHRAGLREMEGWHTNSKTIRDKHVVPGPVWFVLTKKKL